MPIGPYHHGIQVPWLPLGWKAERDGSIRALVSGRKGCEFVSPKLKGAAGLREVEEAIDAINGRGARVNPSCGRSRISKLWVQDTTAKTTVFHFDRGLDVPAANDEVQAMVDFLCEGIADLVFG